ncbi:MAG: amino acid ABC transporter permease [Spirochaetota bacterium]
MKRPIAPRGALQALAGLVHSHRRALTELGHFLLVAALAAAVVVAGTRNLRYSWQWFRVPRYLFTTGEEGLRAGVLLRGLLVTLQISGLGLLLASVFGLVTALFRLSRSYTANILAQIYLEAVRNTPLLIQLFLIYFVAAPIIGLSPFWSAVLALSLFEGAYASEIIRGSIVSIPRHQWESCYSLGLTQADTYRCVVLPQALRRILPPLTGQAVSLVKDSALVSTIAIFDLTMAGSSTVSDTFLTFEIWFTVAAVYLVVNGTLSLLSHMLEKKVHLPR